MKFLTKQTASNQMYIFAWGLEIILCICGILIALTLTILGMSNVDSIDAITTTQWLTMLVGFLPLAAIALTELLKIPSPGRLRFLICLVAVCSGHGH